MPNKDSIIINEDDIIFLIRKYRGEPEASIIITERCLTNDGGIKIFFEVER